jgi:hypothetical protein
MNEKRVTIAINDAERNTLRKMLASEVDGALEDLRAVAVGDRSNFDMSELADHRYSVDNAFDLLDRIGWDMEGCGGEVAVLPGRLVALLERHREEEREITLEPSSAEEGERAKATVLVCDNLIQRCIDAEPGKD